MFLNYAALNISDITSSGGITGSTIDSSMWGNVLLQASSSLIDFTGSLQVTDIEVRYGVPDPASWQTLTTIAVPSGSVVSSSIVPINSNYARLLTNVIAADTGSAVVNISFSDRVVTGIDASVISTGQLAYPRNSVALIDTYTISIASSTASIDPMNGAAQFVQVAANTQLSATFGNVPAAKSATTSLFVSASAVTMSFAGIDAWAGGNPSSVTAAGEYLLVLTNYLSASTPIVLGSWQTLS